MTYASVVADFVKSRKYARNQDLKTSWDAGVAFQFETCVPKVARLFWRRGVGLFRVALEDRINDFAKATAAQFRREPAVFEEVLYDALVLNDQR